MTTTTCLDTNKPPERSVESVGELVFRVHGQGWNGGTVSLRAAKCIIGSGPDCTLRIRGGGVRPVECIVLRGPAGSVARCWSSCARLNGRTFGDAPLVVGDRLQFGSIELEVLRDNRPAFGATARVRATAPVSDIDCGDAADCQDAADCRDAAHPMEQLEDLEQQLAALRLAEESRWRATFEQQLSQERATLAQQLAQRDAEIAKLQQQQRPAAELSGSGAPEEVLRLRQTLQEERQRHQEVNREWQRERAGWETQRAEMQAERDRHQAELAVVTADFEARQEAAQADGEALRQQLAAAQTQLAAQRGVEDEQRAAAENERREREQAAFEAARQRDARAAEGDALQAELAQLAAHRAELEQQLAERDQRQAELERQLAERDQRQAELEQQLAERDQRRDCAEEAAAAARAELERAAARHATALQAQIDEATAREQALRTHVAQLQTACETQRREIGAFAGECQSRQQQAERLQASHAGLREELEAERRQHRVACAEWLADRKLLETELARREVPTADRHESTLGDPETPADGRRRPAGDLPENLAASPSLPRPWAASASTAVASPSGRRSTGLLEIGLALTVWLPSTLLMYLCDGYRSPMFWGSMIGFAGGTILGLRAVNRWLSDGQA